MGEEQQTYFGHTMDGEISMIRTLNEIHRCMDPIVLNSPDPEIVDDDDGIDENPKIIDNECNELKDYNSNDTNDTNTEQKEQEHEDGVSDEAENEPQSNNNNKKKRKRRKG